MTQFIGDKIRGLRESADFLQKDMAKRFNVKENTWSQWENNQRTPDWETLKKVAEFFSVSVDFLLDLTDLKYDPRDEYTKELLKYYIHLDDNDKEKVLDLVKAMMGTED